MNEELRQVKVVEFCEALTKRIRTAIAVLGGFAPGAKAEFHNSDNNVIRLQVSKIDQFEWKHTYTLDNGDVREVKFVDLTEAEKYATEKFHNYVFQQGGLYRNGDIHFSKCEIDWHPSGLSTGFNPLLNTKLSDVATWSEFDETLTSKMKWFTQVYRDEWEPAKVIQQGFDQDKLLSGIAVVPLMDDVVAWQFTWNDGEVTIANTTSINNPRTKEIYNLAVKGLLEQTLDAPWRLSYLSRPV